MVALKFDRGKEGMYVFGKHVGRASVKTFVQCIVLVSKIDENGVRRSPGTILGYPVHPSTFLDTPSARFPHESVTLWGASGVSLLSLFGVFVLLVFSCFPELFFW